MEHFYNRFKNPLTYIAVLILIGGYLAYRNIHSSLFPNITFPKIKIIANDGEQPVHKMMIDVTRPLEEAVKRIPDLQQVHSTTSRGSCEISAYLSWKANIYTSQQLIESRINEIRTQLPPNVQIQIERMNPSTLPVMGFILSGKHQTLLDLKQVALYTVRPYLSQLSGVAMVQVQGGRDKEYWVELQPKNLSRLQVTPSEIKNAVAQSDIVASNGYGEAHRRLYLSLTDGSVKDIQQLQNLVVTYRHNRPVYLSDVANIKVHDAIQYVRINVDGKSGVLFNIVKQPNENLIALSNEVNAKVKAMEGILPANLKVTPYYDQAKYVSQSIHSGKDALWIGIAFALIIVIIFLRSIRATFALLVSVPVSIALTIAAIYMVGYTLNLMTLGALVAAIGLVVDDAIVVIEFIHRVNEEHPNEPVRKHIQIAIPRLLPAMIASSLSTIVIFFPFSLMSGIAGAWFTVMANTMIITLACSYLVSWLLLPIGYLFMEKIKKQEHKESKPEPLYQWPLFFLNNWWISLLIAGGLIGGLLLALPHLKSGFLPHMDEGSIVLDYITPPGSSLDQSDRMLSKIDDIIKNNPYVTHFSRRTGTQMGFFITEPNNGDYLIQLKDNRNVSTDYVINQIRDSIAATVPAIEVDLGQVIADRLGDLTTQYSQPIQINVFGNNTATLHKYANRVADLISHVRGTADVFNGLTVAGPSFSVIPKEGELSAFHLTPADLHLQLQTQLSGTVVGDALEQNQATPIRMIYPTGLRYDLTKLRRASVLLPNGAQEPVESLANIKINKGSTEIDRLNLQEMVTVTARLSNRDLGSTIKDIQKTLSQKLQLPKGYHYAITGDYKKQQQSFHELMMIMILAALLVLTVMLFLFRDFRIGLIVLVVGALSISGAVLALYFTGIQLNVGSYTGLIMIVGIIAENSVFTCRYFLNEYREHGVKKALQRAISARFRPKIMTATAAIAALLPLAFAIGTGDDLQQPMAIAVIGGFLVAIPLLQVVLPTLLYFAYAWQDKKR